MIETRNIITKDVKRWKPFVDWLCELGNELYPHIRWSAYGPHPNNSSFTPDKLRINAGSVTADILWITAEWLLGLPAHEKQQAAEVLLDKITSCTDSYIFIDDSFCREVESD